MIHPRPARGDEVPLLRRFCTLKKSICLHHPEFSAFPNPAGGMENFAPLPLAATDAEQPLARSRPRVENCCFLKCSAHWQVFNCRPLKSLDTAVGPTVFPAGRWKQGGKQLIRVCRTSPRPVYRLKHAKPPANSGNGRQVFELQTETQPRAEQPVSESRKRPCYAAGFQFRLNLGRAPRARSQSQEPCPNPEPSPAFRGSQALRRLSRPPAFIQVSESGAGFFQWAGH